ncbi:hypothetical protein SDC9_180706 [bioreactor metagenome]|uniref:Uncharacterized protein n=1 Tax=bioreactor metagenome TaxID=1076179 RepID=A0A645H4H0_9ZZZZ
MPQFMSKSFLVAYNSVIVHKNQRRGLQGAEPVTVTPWLFSMLGIRIHIYEISGHHFRKNLVETGIHPEIGLLDLFDSIRISIVFAWLVR